MNTQEHSARTLFPKIGMRNVKTALAAALCALVYYFLDRGPGVCLHRRYFRHGRQL